MSEDGPGSEVCVVCGKAPTGGNAFAHRYHTGRRFALCCPLCLQLFERVPDRFARGESPKTMVEELLDELKWKNTGN